MNALKAIPLDGQGKPLPDDFPYRGEWLLEERIFLYRPIDQRFAWRGTEMTPFVRRGDDWCFGLNSMTLAFALRVGSEQIFDHNRAQTLYLVRTDDMLPTHGATSAKRYIFQIDDRQTEVIIEAGAPGGTA